MQEYLGLLDPEELEVKRVDLSLGLRAASRYYNDLVAPGVGSVFFIRQLTWSCLALKHAKDVGVSALTLANAIEALGLKAHFNNTDNYQYRGRRAFSRTKYSALNSFKAMSNQQNYVQIRYRQNTSRTLPEDSGLGLVSDGSGYDTFALSASGQELVDQHAREFSPGNVIGLWVSGSQTPSVNRAEELFGPHASKGEKKVVLNRLLSDVPHGFPGIRGDIGRRKHLIEVFKSLSDEWGSEDIIKLNKSQKLYLQDFYKAQDYYHFLAAGQKVLEGIHRILATSGSKVKTKSTGLEKDVSTLVKAATQFLKVEGDTQEPHIEAYKLANYVIAHAESPHLIIAEIVNRDRRVSMLMDDEIVTGPLFNKDELFTAEEFDFNEVPAFLKNFYRLWKDCL